MRYKVFAHSDFGDEPDIIELGDDLSPKEIERDIKEYVFGFFDWGYEKVEEDENK